MWSPAVFWVGSSPRMRHISPGSERLILMSRKLSDFHGQLPLVVLAVLVLCSPSLGAREGSRDWIVFRNCRLIANPANDGDSFHVSVGSKEYLFRLYFVDTPETDEMTPWRVVDQAK